MPTREITLLALLFTGFISGSLLSGALLSGCGSDFPSAPEDNEEVSQEVINMPAGFQVVNNQGVVQVDENFINLALVAKGTVHIPAGGIGGSSAAPQIHYAGVSPVLCIRPVSTYAFIRLVKKSGNTYSYVINGGRSSALFGTPLAETFSWYIFDRMSQVPVTNAGLQVFNAQGELTFSSASRPMRVITAGQIPYAPLQATPAVVSAGRYGVYAACMTQGRMHGAPMMNNQGAMFREGIKIDAYGAATVAAFDYMTSVYGLATSDSGGQILLVDVAGL